MRVLYFKGCKLILKTFFQWNGTTTYDFKIPRDFGTDYGICCWHTPQLNLTEVYNHQIEHNLSEPEWGIFFTNVQKVKTFQGKKKHICSTQIFTHYHNKLWVGC